VYRLPADLPVPVDDGAADHLQGMRLPSVRLPSTGSREVDLAGLPGMTVVYCYPRTGRPDQPSPPGWDAIPGARGCTPQSCAFRDHYGELQALGAREVASMTLLKRLTMIVRDGRIEKVFYPVFPPDRTAGDVVTWLSRG
jgi:peroxiredoxin